MIDPDKQYLNQIKLFIYKENLYAIANTVTS